MGLSGKDLKPPERQLGSNNRAKFWDFVSLSLREGLWEFHTITLTSLARARHSKYVCPRCGIPPIRFAALALFRLDQDHLATVMFFQQRTSRSLNPQTSRTARNSSPLRRVFRSVVEKWLGCSPAGWRLAGPAGHPQRHAESKP